MCTIMQKVLIATGNQGKKRELLDFFGKNFSDQFISLKDLPDSAHWIEPEENGQSFEENALIKARFFGQKSQLPTLGEDSGLILEAFPEKFGLKTKREIDAKDDMDWITQFLDLLDGEENRRATFYSAIALFDPKYQNFFSVLGVSSGVITEFPQAPLEKGIPVSSVFIPDGRDVVFSAMKKSEKNNVSHRGQSATKMLKILQKNKFIL